MSRANRRIDIRVQDFAARQTTLKCLPAVTEKLRAPASLVRFGLTDRL